MLRTTAAQSLSLLAFSASLLGAPAALLAQDNEEGFNKAPDDIIDADKQAAEEKKQNEKMPGERDKKAEERAAAEAEEAKKLDPRENPNQSYYFVGLRFRDVIVPKFIFNIFADGGGTVNVFTFGPEFTSRRNGIEYDIALSYADYSMKPFLFKGKNETNDAYEIVSSDLKIFYATIDLLYDIPVIDDTGRFSVLVGGGLGLGGVVGNLYRVQAYPSDPSRLNSEDVSQWNKCTGGSATPVDPGTGNTYCDPANGHFTTNGKDYSEASWANGGWLPFIFPWISLPQVSFRYKPIKQLQTRADIGFALTSGFYFGASASYGF